MDQENGEEENGSSYQRIDSNVDPAAVEKMPAVMEQVEEANGESKNGEDKNRIDEENSTNRTTNENKDAVPTIAVPTIAVPTIAVTPDQDSRSLHVAGDDLGEGRYRSRSSAIVDPKTLKLHVHAGNGKHKKKRGSLTYSKCWDDTEEKESDEMWRTCNIVTETVAYILWRCTDNHTDRPPWKVCQKVTCTCPFLAVTIHVADNCLQ